MSHDGTRPPGGIDRIFPIETGDGCPFHIAAATLRPDRWGRRRVVSGRGLTADEAKRNCLFEAAERHAALYDDARVTVRGRAREMDNALPVSSLLLISEQQYQQRAAWNSAVESDHHLPAPFDADTVTGWVEATPLNGGARRPAPAALCFLGYPTALPEGFPIPDSSGLASGTTTGDAIERALHECIERDAVAIWWYNRIRRPSPLLAASPLLDAFAAWIKRCRRRFWLLDLTHDLAVPVVAAVSSNDSGADLSLGFGAAATLEDAAFSAMGELVQFEMTKRHFPALAPGPYPHLVTWCRSANIKDNDFLRPDQAARPVAPRPAASALQALGESGLGAFAVNLSPADAATATVRVIVPGLRPIWPRFAPGRLYDVPATLGWREKPASEMELNPVPILY